MQRPVVALLLIFLAVGLALVAAACRDGNSDSGASSVPMPPGWNEDYSSEGLTFSIQPTVTFAQGAIEFSGTVSPDLLKANQSVTLQIWPNGPFRDIGSVGESRYRGAVEQYATQVPVRSGEAAPKGYGKLGPTATTAPSVYGIFGDVMKLPRVIQYKERLLLLEPGRHYLAIFLDDKRAAFAPFELQESPPVPTVSPQAYLRPGPFHFLDSKTGWLSAASCRDQPRATPDSYGNIPTAPEPLCTSGFYGTTDGGQTWTLLSHEAVGTFQFETGQFGLSVIGNQYCSHSPCASTILRTSDGGRHWATGYESRDRLPS